MRAILSVRPKCSHGCVALKEFPLKHVLILKHVTRVSIKQASMRMNGLNVSRVNHFQEHLLQEVDAVCDVTKAAETCNSTICLNSGGQPLLQTGVVGGKVAITPGQVHRTR